MATWTRFEDIEAWKKARELTRLVYAKSKTGAFAKDFALRDQIRRASISITSNIAEGFERDGAAEFAQFLSIAKGSAGELDAQLYVALDEGYLSLTEFREMRALAASTKRLLAGLIQYLRRSNIRGLKYRENEENADGAPRIPRKGGEISSQATRNQKPQTRNSTAP